MSHHYSGPQLTFPRGDARLDFTDLFAFPKPGDASKSILIMDVHPSFDVIKTAPTMTEPFAPNGLYEIKIDTDGDAIANIAFQIRFTSSKGGAQTAIVRRLEGAQAAMTGEGGEIILRGAPVSMGAEAKVTPAGDYRFFAGWRSDPFFFDAGAFNNFQFVNKDFFGDKDICSMALEVPNAALGKSLMGIYARTLISADGGKSWTQAERGARPSQTPFLTGEQNEAYRAAEPKDDARFVGTFAHSLEHIGGFAPAEARRVAGTLLPDLIYYDASRPAAFPDNGRKPTDDVADTFLAIITNGKITGDGIGAHGDLLSEFPYLGAPHDRSR
jgi:hypothetical protein